MNIVTFKWKGKTSSGVQYDSSYVNEQYYSIKNHLNCSFEYTCITDDPKGIDNNINVVPLWDTLSDSENCSRRLFLFSKTAQSLLPEKYMLLDLDATIHGDFSYLFDSSSKLCRLFRSKIPKTPLDYAEFRYHLNCSILQPKGYEQVWDTFSIDKLEETRRYFTGSDQSWINYLILNNKIQVEGMKKGIYEAKWFLNRQIPDDACIVQWAGPRDHRQHPEIIRKWNENSSSN